MKKSLKWTIGILAIAALIFIFKVFTKESEPSPYDNFAKCLSEKGVKMYGAYWCPHCINQKEMFGSSWRYITYVECSLPNGAGQTKECSDAGIKGYPTWEFSDGKRESGEISFEKLSQYSGCKLG